MYDHSYTSADRCQAQRRRCSARLMSLSFSACLEHTCDECTHYNAFGILVLPFFIRRCSAWYTPTSTGLKDVCGKDGWWCLWMCLCSKPSLTSCDSAC